MINSEIIARYFQSHYFIRIGFNFLFLVLKFLMFPLNFVMIVTDGHHPLKHLALSLAKQQNLLVNHFNYIILLYKSGTAEE